ncbi:MAG: hypothetical protein SVV80_03020 [Planctomycetota bacterium]|nr:hypothetical protein [Planctomycetota bacterium]
MRRFIIILTVVFLADGLAGAEITASLEVVAGQAVSAGPYRRAELEVTNSSETTAETVLLKSTGIGLTVRYDLTVPPGATGRRIVFLPAISPAQEYAVTAQDASGQVVARTSASITWPAELVTADAFIDDAFRAWTDEPARWSARTRWNYLLVLAMFVTAVAATLLIRRPMLRVVFVIIIAAGTTSLIVFVYIPAGAVVQEHRYNLRLHDGVGGIELDSFAILSARKTMEWSRKVSPLPYPVWPDRHAADGDNTMVNPVAGTIHLTLRPGLVRIIRPDWRGRPEVIDLPRGRVRRKEDGLIIEYHWIREDALLIHDDSVWSFNSDAVDKITVRNDRAQSYWAFMGGEGGENLNFHTRRLLNYWRNRHQRAGEFYLVNPEGSETGARIEVVRLEEASSW